MSNVVGRGRETSYHVGQMVGPRQVSILAFIGEAQRQNLGPVRLKDLNEAFVGSMVSSVGSLQHRGLVSLNGHRGVRGRAVKTTVIVMTAAGERMADSIGDSKLPEFGGLVIVQE